jgi:hypothetical protein
MRIGSATQSPVRNWLLLALLAIFCLPASFSGQEPVKTLTITKIDPIPLDGPRHSEATESLYYLVDTAYPQDWQDEVESSNTFKVMVDGHATPFEARGSGFGGGEANASFWVYLGAPGKKKIEVTLVRDGKTVRAEKETTVPLRPVLRLLGHYDGECLFENESLQFLAFSAKDLSVKVNGKDVRLDEKPVPGFEGISVLTIPPSLKPGNNSIAYSGADPAGKRFSHTVALFYAADNKVKVGDRFLVTYGGPASKSGPFYYVTADGNVLVAQGSVKWMTILKQTPGGWIGAGEVFGNQILANRAGAGTLALSVKSNFMLGEKLDKTVQIAVEP